VQSSESLSRVEEKLDAMFPNEETEEAEETEEGLEI
jgi:hypothetical protein